jgi:hypothetical protein
MLLVFATMRLETLTYRRYAAGMGEKKRPHPRFLPSEDAYEL